MSRDKPVVTDNILLHYQEQGRARPVEAAGSLPWPSSRTGPGRVGKTCLALATAAALHADFADGVCFVLLLPERVILSNAQAFAAGKVLPMLPARSSVLQLLPQD